jgi:IMP dehydrogenase / GMP reductase domain
MFHVKHFRLPFVVKSYILDTSAPRDAAFLTNYPIPRETAAEINAVGADAKALAAGASTVMIGSLFAGTDARAVKLDVRAARFARCSEV